MRPRLDRDWRTSAQRSVRSLAVVVLDEHTQHSLEMARSEDEQPVEALRARRAHEALRMGVGPRRPEGRADHPDAFAPEDPSKAVVNFESRSWIKNLTSPRAAEKLRLRACWATHIPFGFWVQPARWTRLL